MTSHEHHNGQHEGCGQCSEVNQRVQFAAKNKKTENGASKKPKGFIGRFLDRLTKANEREFGRGGPSCCH
ncbi:MAG: LDCC motif putative metal-binding protein [Pseudomonadota bacterium]